MKNFATRVVKALPVDYQDEQRDLELASDDTDLLDDFMVKAMDVTIRLGIQRRRDSQARRRMM